MKTIKFTLASFAVVAAFGLTLFLSKCKKDPPLMVKTYTISGLCAYPDYASAMVPAKGTVLTIFAGSDPNPLATTFADASGNYKFMGLLPGPYSMKAKYNTENQNTKEIDGIDFAVNINVVLGSANLTQNIVLATVAPTGTMKIALDTSVNLFRQVTLDKAHSRISFETDYGPSGQGALFPGFFGALSGQTAQTAFNLTKFAFDEATPANTVIEGYVLLHERSTGEDGRDGLGQCGSKALLIDTVGMTVGGVAKARPETDTCKFISTSVVRYGNGYLCKAILRGFLMHKGPGNNDPICPTCPADTAFGFTGPYDVPRDLPVDMYFEYQGKNYVPGTNWYYLFQFENTFTFSKKAFNIKHASIGDAIKVDAHIDIKGLPKKNY